METLENSVTRRYFRKTMTYPEGSVVHHGDCDFFSIHICTCGLHHDLKSALAAFVEQWYPLFFEEIALSEPAREKLMRGTKKS